MKRVIIAGTIALLIAIIVITSLGQDGLLQAFIANDPISQGVRVVLIGLLATFLFTAQPRSIEFRTVLSAASAMLTFGVAILLSQNSMAALDAVLFVEVAIIFALEAIEAPVRKKGAGKKIQVVYYPKKEKIQI